MKQEWFRERWDEISDVRSGLSDMVLSAGKAGYNSYCRNFERWDLFGRALNRETEQITSLKNYKEHYEFLANWVDLRLEWLDGFFHSDAFVENFTGSAQDIPSNSAVSIQVGNDAYKTLSKSHKLIGIDPFTAVSNCPGHRGEEVEYIFDQDPSTKYCCAKAVGGTVEITFSMLEPTVISDYAIITANDTEMFTDRNPTSWTLYGKNSAGSYVEINGANFADPWYTRPKLYGIRKNIGKRPGLYPI